MVVGTPPKPAEAPDPSRPWLERYPPEVPRSIDLPDVRLPALVEASVARWPRRDALRFYGSRMSYQRLWELSGRFAAALHRDGFRPGDRLALDLPNCPIYPIAFLGALRLGAVVAQVSPLYVADDLTAIVRDARPRGLVTLDILTSTFEPLAVTSSIPIRYVARLRDCYPFPARLFVDRVLRRRGFTPRMPSEGRVREFWSALRTRGEFPAPTGRPSEELAVLQYTGGTTGTPRAAMLSHRNLVANALQCRAWFSTMPAGSSTLLAVVPFFHAYGLTVALTYPLASGSTIVIQLRPEPGELLRLIAKHKPQELPGVPALYRSLADHPDVGRYDLKSIRVCVSGSAPLPEAVARRFEEITGGSLLEGYGLTEASPVTHANPIPRERRRAGSIGLPFPLTDQRVVDLESGSRTLGPGEVGELTVRGPQVMLGYYERPEESRQVLRDGWLLTGDAARVDPDGFAYIVGRAKEMINVGGLKVYPREVEAVLESHPSVAEAAAIGAPDAALGEVVEAFVVLRPGRSATEAELIELVRSRIAHYKAPRSIGFLEALPKSGLQKLLRRELKPGMGRAPTPPAG